MALDDPRSDEELLAAHIDGDGDAFTKIVERRASFVWSVALKITGNPTDAADAYQESFLAAHRAATSFKGDAAFSTWLYRITVNAALSQRRKKQKITVHQAITDDEYASVLEDRAKPFAEQVDVCLDVSEALSGLSEDQQRAVVLVDMFGYSQVEAAEVLQIPEGTVKSRISRARKTLARDLQHLSPGMRSRRAGQGREDVRDD
ncbi:MAG: sigma-70 family RNA polymerase sigma factor [Actinomycetia bacterium]|nr:sigma-70 family RNA polymerase sigma factor [Actinomycetes bacterium]